MNTETLKKLGLNDDQVKSVMAEYGKELNPLKEQVESLTSERDSATEQLTTVSGQLDQLQTDHKGDADLKAEIDKLKAENEEASKASAEKLTQVKLDSATKLALTKAGALNVTAAEALLDKSTLKFDDKGRLTGLAEQLKSLQEADDSKFLFKAGEPAKPDTPNITPSGNPNPDPAGGTSMVDKIAARLAGKQA